MKKLGKYLFRLIFALLIVYCSLLFFISTNSGTSLLLSAAAKATSHKLQFGEVYGTITSGIRINNLSYRDKNTDVEIKHVTTKIDFLALFKMQVIIEQLLVDDGTIKITANKAVKEQSATAQYSAFSPPAWLRFFDLDHVNINNVVITENNHTYQLNNAVIQRTASGTYKYVISSDIAGLDGTLTLHTYPFFSWNLVAKISKVNHEGYGLSSVALAIKTYGEWDLFKKQAFLAINDISGKVHSKDLSGGGTASYQNGELQIDKLHLVFGNTRLEATGKIGSHMNFNWNVAVPDIGILFPDIAGSLVSQGSISGTSARPVINAQIASKNLQLPDLFIKNINADIKTVNIDLNNIEMAIFANDINYFDLTLSSAQINAKTKLSKQGLSTSINGHLDNNTKLNGTISLPGFTSFSNLDQKIETTINLDTSNLSNLPITIPNVKNLNGQLHAVFTMKGEISNPSWLVNADIIKGAVTIPVTGMDIRNVSVNAKIGLDKPLELTGKFISGGNGSLHGGLTFNNDGYHFVLNVSGNNLLVANTHEYKVTASPDMVFSMTPAGANITGKIIVPTARITPVDFTQVVSIPDETVFVHQKKTDSTFYRNLAMDFNAKLGDDIQISYDQLKTRLYGSVNILKSAGAPPTAVGDLYTDNGFYKAYGTQLKITTGRIIYTGNLLSNPGIDLRAVKEIKKMINSDDVSSLDSDGQLIVGIQVQGTVSKPSISFFSNPSGLSQKDILSYLVFGYPQSQVTSASGLALLNSLSPTGKAASGITDGLQKTFGLTELGVSSTEYYDPSTSTTGSTTTVNVGKNVTKNLSIHYSVGLLYPVSVLNIVYQINRHLKLQAETSTLENGADVMYSLERK